MNWKILLVSIIAIILIGGLVAFQIIGIDLGIVPLIIGVIGVIAPILGNLRKPKISLKIEEPEFEKREYGKYQGYKIITHVTNKGKKIAYNLEASIDSKDPIEFLKLVIDIKNNQKTVKEVFIQPFDGKNYSWIDSKGKAIEKNLIDKLRTDDEMKLMVPTEYKLGNFWVIGLNANFEPTSRNNTANETLLNLEPKKTYNFELTLKGEDNDKNTILKKKDFKIDTP